MPRLAFFRKSLLVAILGILLFGIGLAGWQRNTLLQWYYVRGLARADDDHLAIWIERVLRLDQEALPGLYATLQQNDERSCRNASDALAELMHRWSPDDPRWRNLTNDITEGFPRFSSYGQKCTLQLQTSWLILSDKSSLARLVIPTLVRLLDYAARSTDSDVRNQGLLLAISLLERNRGPECSKVGRDLALACLSDARVETRILAVKLAQRREIGLSKQLAPRLLDPVAEIRTVALQALATEEDEVPTEDLLRYLHDSDADVRQTCELILRKHRHLTSEEVSLGWLLTDPRSETRLRVLDRLATMEKLDPGVWLRYLSHDPVPAVRAAAIRAATEHPSVDLTDRIDQMRRNDPSPTVCQLAQHFFSHPKYHRSKAEE